MGHVERSAGGRVRRAGRAPRSPLSRSPGCAARWSSVRRTRSWRRRSRLLRPAPALSSSTATATTSACRSTTSARRPRHRPRAAFVVHIGGHIAFEIEQIARVLPRSGHLPDRGLRACAWRDLARAASGHLGRRRALVVRGHEDDLDRGGRDARLGQRRPDRVRALLPKLRQARLRVAGLNFRLSEFTAAIGLVQTERMDEIVAWKNDGGA